MFRFLILLLAVSLDSDAQLQPGNTNDYYNSHTENQAISLVRFRTFDIELLRELSKSKSNVFLSPASVKMTLAMILEGAYGRSADEISQVIGIPKGIASNKLTPLIHVLQGGTNGTILTSSSGIFLSHRRNIPEEYFQKIQGNYGAFVKPLDFSNAYQTTQEINDWVKKQTHGLIQTLVSPDNFQSEATAVIANAVYFKGLWKKAFDPDRTTSKCFRTSTNACSTVNMMQNIDTYNYKYFADIDVDVIELPYNDNVYSMYIFLPRKNDVSFLLRDLGSNLISRISELKETEIQLEIPKFSIEFERDLTTPLQTLEINEIFRPTANLSGIVRNGELYISNLIHKAKIEVDEIGSIAAGASGAIVIPLMGTTRPRIVADHPFVFFIFNKAIGTTLFEGVLYNPLGDGSAKQRNQNKFIQQIYKIPRFEQ